MEYAILRGPDRTLSVLGEALRQAVVLGHFKGLK